MSRTMAFFGATGGVASTALARALKAGYHCTMLTRTPEKLCGMLIAEHNLTDSTLKSHLTIILGTANDISAISRALVSPLNPNCLVNTIMSGMGSYPVLRFSLFHPIVLAEPNIVYNFHNAVFAAIEELEKRGVSQAESGEKPLFIMSSSVDTSLLSATFLWCIIRCGTGSSSPRAVTRRMRRRSFSLKTEPIYAAS